MTVAGGRSMVTDQELELVEEGLKKAVASDVRRLAEASQHIICAGGKRIRPKVVLLSYKAAGGKDIRQAVPLAVAVELLHTASLIHDDINDHSSMRRGQATVNARWGDSLALLTGDFVFIKLLGLMPALDPRLIQVLAGACRDLVEGEVLQFLSLGDTRMDQETYLTIVRKKTASLFSACAELGGVRAGAGEREVAALKEYGLNLGMAFQIRDDTLDLVGHREELGKPVGSDLEQGKMSLATLFALRSSDRAGEVLFASGPGRRARARHAAQAIELLRDSRAPEYAMQKAKEYSEKGKEALSVLAGSEARAALFRLADVVLARDR